MMPKYLWFQLLTNTSGNVSTEDLIIEEPFSGSYLAGLPDKSLSGHIAFACLFVLWVVGFATKALVIYAVWQNGIKVQPINLLILVDLMINLVYR